MLTKLNFELYCEVEDEKDFKLCEELLTDQIAIFATVNKDKCKVKKLNVTTEMLTK